MGQLKAIVAGSTGLIGSFLVSELVRDEDFTKVILLTRKQSSNSSNKINDKVVNFDELSKYDFDEQIDVAFCCLGTTMKKAGSKEAFLKVDYTYCLEFAKLVKKMGAKKFVLVSSLGASTNTSNFYLKTKGQIEEAIAELGFDSFIIMRPSMLLGDRNESRLGESIGKAVMTTFDFMIAGPFKKYKAIHAKTVAGAMLKASKDNFEGRVIFESDKIAAYA